MCPTKCHKRKLPWDVLHDPEVREDVMGLGAVKGPFSRELLKCELSIRGHARHEASNVKAKRILYLQSSNAPPGTQTHPSGTRQGPQGAPLQLSGKLGKGPSFKRAPSLKFRPFVDCLSYNEGLDIFFSFYVLSAYLIENKNNIATFSDFIASFASVGA